jgi:hypothetical protein
MFSLYQWLSGPRLTQVVCIAAAVLLATGRGFGQSPFVVDDVVVSSRNVSLMDPEFSDVPPLMTWQDPDRRLWVSTVESDGTWQPRNGKQIMLDDQLTPIGQTRQGPEWVSAAGHDRIVYTKTQKKVPYIYQARIGGNGWETAALPDSAYCAVANASKDRGDVAPRTLFHYRPPTGESWLGWRSLDPPFTIDWIPVQNPENPRWASGVRAVSMLDPVSGEVVLYDIDSRQPKQLTFDALQKRFPSVWRHAAVPDTLQLGSVMGYSLLGVYTLDKGVWKLTDQQRPPSPYHYIFRPEYFEFQGRSFLHFTTTTSANGEIQGLSGESEVWITEISPEGKLLWFRRVNNPRIKRIKDSESIVIADKAYVYYAEILVGGTRVIHRCATGL